MVGFVVFFFPLNISRKSGRNISLGFIFIFFFFSRNNLDGKNPMFWTNCPCKFPSCKDCGAKSEPTLWCLCLLEGETSHNHYCVEGETALQTLLVQ